MSRVRDEWIEIGLCTDPADRPKAEAGIRSAYTRAGLKPPKRIVWCGSPLRQGLTSALVFRIMENPDIQTSVGASVWGSVGDSVVDSVKASVGDFVRGSVQASV